MLLLPKKDFIELSYLIDSLRTLEPVFLTLKWEIAIPCIAKSIILNNLLCMLVLKSGEKMIHLGLRICNNKYGEMYQVKNGHYNSSSISKQGAQELKFD